MDIWWVTPEKRSRSSIASFFMFSFHNRANPRLVLLLVPLVRGNGFTALLGQKQWCFNLQKSNVCLVLAIVYCIFLCKLHKHRMQLYLHVYFCHNMTHDMTMSYKLSVFASFTDSQCYVLLSALEARMTRRTALITPPPPPDHGKSPGWHMTRAWFGKKTAVVWPWGKELKIYLHKELKAMYRHLKAISWPNA